MGRDMPRIRWYRARGPERTIGFTVLLFLLSLLVISPCNATVLYGPITNPENHHDYYLLSANTWSDAEAEAVSLGGHLATIRNAYENQWIYDTFSSFGGTKRLLWIGLNDVAHTGTFRWVSGEPVTYLNFSPDEPSFFSEEHYVYMYPADVPDDGLRRYPGTWNNYADVATEVVLETTYDVYAVAEVGPSGPIVTWIGGTTGTWSDAPSWSPSPPTSNSVVVVPFGTTITIDVPGAQVGNVTLASGSTLVVSPGSDVNITGEAINNGTMILSGDVTSYGSGNAFVQNGTLTINPNVALRGFDTGGSDYAFVQTGGATIVAGTLDFDHGFIYIQGGTVNVNNEAALRGFDTGGSDLAYIQTDGTVTIDGTLETTNAGLEGGTLGGGGTLSGNLFADGGTLFPGSSPGTFTITGNYTQTGTTLAIEIQGTGASEYDRLVVTGAAQLGGTLTVTLLNGFMPSPGDSFTIMTYASHTGTFSTTNLPALTDGSWLISYNNTSVVLSVRGSGGGGSGHCFIATAAFGSYLHPYVQILRNFRDVFLLTTRPGRAFVSWYYRISPPLAEMIFRNAMARGAVRIALLPLIAFGGLSLSVGFLPALVVVLAVLIVGLLGMRRLMRSAQDRAQF
ncbi:MAG: Lectin C-type domain protein [Syntrophorhabdus sp. PtaB.Bin184]|nr:MAG: Lectin C-type domain protein [Syntrophorhabdus sp. PtaB.Bin184]